MDKERLAETPAPVQPAGKWTSVDEYFAALARRRTARRARSPRPPRTQTDEPHFLLSTLPFLALFAGLAVLTAIIMVAAFPGWQPQAKRLQQPAEHETGYAAKGWLQEAQKEMHR
jgi:hypothetical protein